MSKKERKIKTEQFKITFEPLVDNNVMYFYGTRDLCEENSFRVPNFFNSYRYLELKRHSTVNGS